MDKIFQSYGGVSKLCFSALRSTCLRRDQWTIDFNFLIPIPEKERESKKRIMLGNNFWHNFMSQLTTWLVGIGKGVSPHDSLTYSYQSQLAMCQVWHNFVPQLDTWRVVIGKSMSLHGPLTYLYQSQLAMCWVVAQSCAKSLCP